MRYSKLERPDEYFDGLIIDRRNRQEDIINKYTYDLFSEYEYSNSKKIYNINNYNEKKGRVYFEHISDGIDILDKMGFNRRGTFSIPAYPTQQPREPTEEELREIEIQRKLGELRSQVRSRFDYTVPTTVAEEEMQKLLDPQVDPAMARWYLLLRQNGVDLPLPASMNGEFSAMMEYVARDYIARTYGDTRVPLEVLWGIVQLNLGDVTKYVVQAAEHPATKHFPLGKVYAQEPVTGLRERLDPLLATQLLAYGLIGKKEENVEAAYQAFDAKKLEIARNQLKHSHLSRGKIFSQIAPYLGQLAQGDAEAAGYILNYFREHVPIEEVSDLVAGVEDLFHDSQPFSNLTAKMQDGTYADMFDNSRLRACTFLPSGIHKTASLVYYHDPDIGLMHLVPEITGDKVNPAGVAILTHAVDAHGNKWILVDSVEGGAEIDRVRDSLWLPAAYDGILGVASDVGAQSVMFNGRVHNGRSKRMIEYVGKRHPQATVHLEKVGMQSQDFTSLGVSLYDAKEALEAWGTSGNPLKGEVSGHAVELRRN